MPPAIIAGHKFRANLRPAPYRSVTLAALHFSVIAQPPSASARAASPSQLSNHKSREGNRLEINAVNNALTPMRTPPQPGTAVNDPARSIVSRMYFRFSNARSLMETTLADFMNSP